jgi:hypothetical protein
VFLLKLWRYFTAAILHWCVAGGFEWLAGVSKKYIIILKILHSKLKQRKSSRKCVEMMRLLFEIIWFREQKVFNHNIFNIVLLAVLFWLILWSQASKFINILYHEYGQNCIIDNERGGNVVPLSCNCYIYYLCSIKICIPDCILAIIFHDVNIVSQLRQPGSIWVPKQNQLKYHCFFFYPDWLILYIQQKATYKNSHTSTFQQMNVHIAQS